MDDYEPLVQAAPPADSPAAGSPPAEQPPDAAEQPPDAPEQPLHETEPEAWEKVSAPAWAMQKEVVELGEFEDMYQAVGPVVPWTRWTAITMASAQAGVVALGWQTSTCTGAGYATYPLWVWLTLVPAAALRLHVEWRALKHYIPVYVHCSNMFRIGGFTVMGMKTQFVSWLVFYLLCSNLNLVDLGMDSLFTATVQRTLQCPGVQVEEVWARVWVQSMFGKVGIPVPSMQWIILGSWALSLMQLVVPIVQTLDKKVLRCNVDYRLGGDGLIHPLCDETSLENDRVLSLLSESAGFASLQSLALPRSLQAIRDWAHAGCKHRSARAAHTLGVGFASRVLLSYILENCLQANIQTTLFAINRSVVGSSGTQAQLQALASIALSILMTVLKLSEAKAFLSAAPKIVEEIGQLPNDRPAALKQMRQFATAVRAVKVGCGIMVLSLGYASCKLAAAFWCRDAVWNVTGCVDLSA